MASGDVLRPVINSTIDMSNDAWLNKLINPLKIIEVLLYNQEQVNIGL